MAGATVLAFRHEQVLPLKINAGPRYSTVLLASSHAGVHGNIQFRKMLWELRCDDLP
jgi:hypothetical protein